MKWSTLRRFATLVVAASLLVITCQIVLCLSGLCQTARYNRRDRICSQAETTADYGPHCIEAESDLNSDLLLKADNTMPNWTLPAHLLALFTNPCWNETVLSDELYVNNFFQKYDCFYRGLFTSGMKDTEKLLQNTKRRWRVRCYPQYYVIGAPKSGTTDLYDYLLQHPDIIPGGRKEPEFWNDRRFGKIMNPKAYQCPGVNIPAGAKASIEDYLDLFDGAAELIRSQKRLKSDGKWCHMAVVGDHTPDTMFDLGDQDDFPRHPLSQVPLRTNADLLHKINPKTRLVAILRNPVERALSQYKTNRDASPEGFHLHIVQGLVAAQQCLLNYDYRYCLHHRDLIPMSIRVGMYVGYLANWFDVFGREQILVIRFEDYVVDPISVVNKVFKHIGVEEIPNLRLKLTIKNRATHKFSMLPQTREILQRFYKPWNEKLVDLLNKREYLWEDEIIKHWVKEKRHKIH